MLKTSVLYVCMEGCLEDAPKLSISEQISAADASFTWRRIVRAVRVGTVGREELLNLPVVNLDAGVRARKCFLRLGITSIGKLIQHTADDLLNCKNFSVLSLLTVRERLAEVGLALRND